MATVNRVAAEVDRPSLGVAQLIQGIAANQHAKVLVVGVRGTNVPPEWRVCPQVVFWDGDDADTRAVPAAVKLVLVTRFNSHSSFRRLVGLARHGQFVLHPEHLGTGELKDLLQPIIQKWEAAKAAERESRRTAKEEAKEQLDALVPEAAADEDTDGDEGAPVMTALARAKALARGDMKRFRPGELQEFVERNLNREATKVPGGKAAESRRLQKLAVLKKYLTTPESIAQTITAMVREGGPVPQLPAGELEPLPESRQLPAHIPPVVAEPRTPATDDDAQLLRLVDEAIAGLVLVNEALGSLGRIKEAIALRASKRAELKRLLSEL
jgi:hypothetical protein